MAVAFVFATISVGLTGPIKSRLGRGRIRQVACVFCIIGAERFLKFMVCKSISSAGIGMLQASAMVYGSECVVPNKRVFYRVSQCRPCHG